MSELGFLPIFLEKDLLKVDKILGLTFFQARKDFEGFVNSAFPNKKNLAQKRSLFMTNKFESKCL